MQCMVRPLLLALAVLALAGCTPEHGASDHVQPTLRARPTALANQVWSLATSRDTPPECSPRSLQLEQAKTVSTDTTIWPVFNSGSACTIKAGSVTASTRSGTKAALTLPSATGTRQVLVLPQYAQAWMGVSTNIRCRPAAALTRVGTVQIHLRTDKGKNLGQLTTGGSSCRNAAVALWIAPYSESTSKRGAPASLVAHVPTSSLRLKGTELVAELVVINTSHTVYKFDGCPRVSVAAVSRTQEIANTTALRCKKPPVVAKKSSTTFPVHLEVPRDTKLSQLNVGAYLNIGIGDDASLTRADAKPSPNSFIRN